MFVQEVSLTVSRAFIVLGWVQYNSTAAMLCCISQHACLLLDCVNQLDCVISWIVSISQAACSLTRTDLPTNHPHSPSYSSTAQLPDK